MPPAQQPVDGLPLVWNSVSLGGQKTFQWQQVAVASMDLTSSQLHLPVGAPPGLSLLHLPIPPVPDAKWNPSWL